MEEIVQAQPIIGGGEICVRPKGHAIFAPSASRQITVYNYSNHPLGPIRKEHT